MVHHEILGKQADGKCLYNGTVNGKMPYSVGYSSPPKVEWREVKDKTVVCLLDGEILKNIFAPNKFEITIMDEECTGTFIDFSKELTKSLVDHSGANAGLKGN